MRRIRSFPVNSQSRDAMLLTLAGTIMVLSFMLVATTKASIGVEGTRLCNRGAFAVAGKHLVRLVEGLRSKTGWQELGFDGEGFLQLGDRSRVHGGSKTARELILAAMTSHDSFELRASNRDGSVAFAQIQPIQVRLDAEGRRSEIWVISIDFADFAELRGGPETLAAFDPAMNLLHELAHAVLGLRDNYDETDSLGDCERFTNRIRFELGLPERLQYRAQNSRTVLPGSTATVVQAELTFVQVMRSLNEIKERRRPLLFSVENVGVSTMVFRARPSGVSAMQ